MRTLYLDNNSTTPVAPEVVAAMQPVWRETFGNPSSLHRAGQAARHAVETAREKVAALIGAKPREIVFTSGGTEADNLAIRGTLAAYPTRKHLVTTAVEHEAVLSLCRLLETRGFRVTCLGVDAGGRLDLDRLADAVGDDTALVSVMYANNETGVIFPIPEVAEICRGKGIPLHVDAVQAAGKLPIDVSALGAQLVSLSAHKMHGPKGVGALYVGKGARLRGTQIGGHQERDIRPGTENVSGIVGFGEAARLAAARLAGDYATRVAGMRDRLESAVLERVPFAAVNGDRASRTVNTTNIGFAGISAEAILVALSERGVCASSGAACSSGSMEPSHVLQAMGIDPRVAHGAIRFSLSHETTETEIDEAVGIIVDVTKRLAQLTPA